MITVEFYVYDRVYTCGNNFHYNTERKVIETGKSTIEEAFDVAVANGCNPCDTINYIFS